MQKNILTGGNENHEHTATKTIYLNHPHFEDSLPLSFGEELG